MCNVSDRPTLGPQVHRRLLDRPLLSRHSTVCELTAATDTTSCSFQHPSTLTSHMMSQYSVQHRLSVLMHNRPSMYHMRSS